MSELHQYLSVTPDSSSHKHASMVESPTSETSTSFRAASTDADCERCRSSPSTSYTSACESESDVDGVLPGNVASVAGHKVKTSGVEGSGTASDNILPPSTRSWRMPFAKASAPPRAMPSASSSNADADGLQRLKASASNKTFGPPPPIQAQDNNGSVVETTSQKAAQALADYWNEVRAQADANGKGLSRVANDANDYIVVARVEDGKRIFKIRPRSRPNVPADKQEGHVPHQRKFQTGSPSLQLPPSIRLTRSIPNLRHRTSDDIALFPNSRDRGGFYRPACNTAGQPENRAFLTLPAESPYHPICTEATMGTTGKSTLQTAASIPNLRAHREQDVFGKLLGWNDSSSPMEDRAIAGPSRLSPVRRVPRSPSPTQSSAHSAEPASTSPRPSFEDYQHASLEQFPHDLSASLQEASQSSILSDLRVPSAKTSSPFGQGVRLPGQPRLKRKKSLRQLHGTTTVPSAENRANNTFDSLDSFDLSYRARSLREVGSSETIRTAKGPDRSSMEDRELPPLDSPRTPLAVPAQPDGWMSDTRIFDSLQCTTSDVKGAATELKTGLKPMESSNDGRHERAASTTSLVSIGGSSLHSTCSATLAGEQAHTITVTSVPGDDRRFVIWGRRPGPPVQGPVRRSSGSRMSPASFASTNTAGTGSSKRSSNPRRHDDNEQFTPPTSASSSSSPWSSSPPVQKVLLAATIDRWIADMTSRIEGDLMTDFFLTYRSFLLPISLCKLLITRFEWALQPGNSAEDIAGRRIVRVRTYVVFRHWLLNYFHEDFVPDRELRLILTAWLNRMGKDERLRPNPTDLRLIKSLKKVVKRLKAAYSTIGVDQAADANTLIKTSLEADPKVRGRLRADSMASISSLHSISEEQAEILAPGKSVIPSDVPGQTSSRSEGFTGQQLHTTKQDIRTSSSEDDVDLDIEVHISGYDSDEQPRIPAIIPISPPRNRQYSPSHARKSRSPPTGPHNRLSRPIEGLTLIPDNHRVSRAIASTVGSFSKLRRMMGNRRQPGHSTGNSPKYYNDAFPDTSQLSALQPGDLEVSNNARLSLPRNLIAPDNPVESLGIDAHAASMSLPSAATATPSASSFVPDLRHAASNTTMRRQASDEGMLPEYAAVQASQNTDGPVTARGLAPAAQIRPPDIQLDDYESSGDESDVGGVAPVRTLRRLPAARDLRRGKAGGHMALSHRHSVDSMASYGTRRLPSCALEPIPIPSIATYDSNSSVPDVDFDDMLDQGLIPYFVPPTDSEDEDEPGDVEAALRRLEGQVDDAKQQSNARRVERYLKMSEQAKSSGGYVYGEDGEASDGEGSAACRSASLAISVAFAEDPPALAEKCSVAASEVAGEEPQSAAPSQPDECAPEAAGATLRVPRQGSNSNENRTVQRKSSMRRFFGSTKSVSLWPMTNSGSKIPKARVVQPPIYRSFLFSFKVEALARHFCIIERDLLEKVTWQELIGSSWKERLELDDFTDWDTFMKMRAKLNSEAQEQALLPYSSLAQPKIVGDVQTVIHRFNLMCKWIASEIVLTTSTAERALLMTKIIKLAFKSYQMYNFQTATQIVHALQLPSIERLKKTWSKVPSFELRLFSQLKYFCSPLRDFRLLREATGALASLWGPPGQEDRDPDMALQGIPGALPFFGLILRDLAISTELPTFLDPSNPRAPAEIDEDTMLLPSYADPSEFSDLPSLPEGLPLRPLINVHKYRTIAKTVQLVMTFKELAGTYPYEPELPLYRKCLTIQCLPMRKITELSSACER